MAKSPEEMAASMIQNLKENTGKTLQEWLNIVISANLEKHGQIVKFLKSGHGVTHGYANLIAAKTLQEGQEISTAEDLVTSQYAGEKAGPKPIYGAIINAVNNFGSDMGISPKKTYMSLRRKKQFAIIQPSTKTRLDVGINLKSVDATERLEPSGSFNQMVSHRVRLTEKEEVDAELISWLKIAYENA